MDIRLFCFGCLCISGVRHTIELGSSEVGVIKHSCEHLMNMSLEG